MMKHRKTNNKGSTESSIQGNLVWRNLRDKSLRPGLVGKMSRISKREVDIGLYFSKKTSRLNHIRLKNLVNLQVQNP